MYLLTEQQADTAGFKLLCLTASGGSATVYKALHKTTGTVVALKVLNPGADPLRVQREARVLTTLQHPNIAALVDVGETASIAYLATQWIEGKSLRRWLDLNVQFDQSPLDLDLALSLTRCMANALDHAHANGVFHGDVNPNNILISPSQEAIIIDFGIGRAPWDQTITATTDLAGTPRYLAPELITGDAPSAGSDQYALALVVYEMLTGQWPYSGHQSNAAVALHHQLYTQPTPIRELRPCLSASMDEVFTRALAKSPIHRFANIQCFYDALFQATSSVSTTSDNHPSILRVNSPRIGPAVVLGLFIVSSLWWTHGQRTIPLFASVSTTEDHDIQDVDKIETNSVLDSHSCNLYRNAEFDNELEDNFYQDAQYAQLAIRVEDPDISSSPILQVGDIDQYGNYGIILDVIGGHAYSFSADLIFKDYVHKAELTIFWLDESWQVIEGKEDKLTINRLFDGTFHLSNVIAPDIARYAVPTIYKDASSGIVYADNINFSATDQTCNE